MNRRSFFRGLALLGAGAATAPSLFLPKLIEPVRWKVHYIDRSLQVTWEWVPNPEWINAKYEYWIIGTNEFKAGLSGASPWVPVRTEYYPVRGNSLTPDGMILEYVPPFIRKPS